MKFNELIKSVAKATGYEDDEISTILEMTFAIIVGRLLRGGSVYLPGVGTLTWVERKQSRRLHPSTGKEVIMPACKILKLRPAERIRFQPKETVMDKYAVEIDPEKVEPTKKKEASAQPKKERETNVPWDPEKGTEPYEKKKR